MTEPESKRLSLIPAVVRKARHILDLSKRDKIDFINSFDVILTELTGVVWWLTEDIPNAGRAIMQLKEFGKDVKFVTNYSRYTDEQFLQRMSMIGITNVKKGDIVQPCKTLTQYLKRFLSGQVVFTLCNHEMNKQFYKQGIKISIMEPNTNISFGEVVENLQEPENVGAVVIDWNLNLTYSQLAMAHQYLQKESCAFIAGSTDMYVQVARKFKTLGPGFFINLLRESTGRDPIVWGKPGPNLCEELMKYYRLDDASRVLFIGGDLKNDIEFASSCGYQTCFVATGTSTVKDMMLVPDKYKPDYIARTIGDFTDLLSGVVKRELPNGRMVAT